MIRQWIFTVKVTRKMKKPQHKTISDLFEELNISHQGPRIIKTGRGKKKCLVDFENIQNSVAVDIDKEIKDNSKIQCKGKRCDFVLWVDKKFLVFIEAKGGRARYDAIEQFKDTFHWLKSRGILLEKKCVFLLIGKIKSSSGFKERAKNFINNNQSFIMEDKTIHRIDCGASIYKYLKDNSYIELKS